MSLGFALWGRPPGSSRTRLGRPGRRPQDWSPAPRSLPKESKLSDIAHDCVRHIITARRANEDHCDSGAVLPGPSCHPHHIRAIDSLSASRRHGPAGTFHRRRLQNTRGSEALAAELLAPGAIRTISAQSIPYQRPVDTAPQEHSIGGGYKTPAVQKPLPRNSWLQVLDVVVLAAALAISSWLVLKRRSRKALVALAIGSVAYFGFYR